MSKENRIKSFLKLEKLVNEHGITFYALSKELGIAPTVFSDWKAGRSIPKTDKLLKIGKYFNVSITEFIE